ncbi:acylphosphatase [Desulfurispirillum indicum]|uniref:acylphosphatase n=1 Tax=Desulfurispirillum indicum TaxID=936456 RepID=UPI001CFBC2C2|nr:acylphosphatase [Desulfurispirillum indicum]UCZ56571.1 acylphosphatase [Desulfurispirillum indicum]
MQTLCYIVRGKVQGVGFRYFVHGVAQTMGVAGTVENLSDGSVRIYACLDEADQATFKARVAAGPPLSRVDEIEERKVQAHAFEGFRIVG